MKKTIYFDLKITFFTKHGVMKSFMTMILALAFIVAWAAGPSPPLHDKSYEKTTIAAFDLDIQSVAVISDATVAQHLVFQKDDDQTSRLSLDGIFVVAEAPERCFEKGPRNYLYLEYPPDLRKRRCSHPPNIDRQDRLYNLRC